MLLDARAIGSAGGGSGAPVGATYITQIPDVTLTNEQALSLLATGILKSATATGVVSIAIAGTDYQAADAFLTSIGLLGTAADKMIYTTAVDTAAETDLSAFARTFLDDATQLAVQTTLGLVPGTNVQTFDAFLTSIATLGTAADRMIYTTGVDTAAETGLSAFSRSFLDDASEAAFKATVNLEIGVDVQAWDADLDTISGLAKTDGNFIVGDGVAWVVESGATARASLGLGTIATQNANNVSVTGGSITGITDLDVADGGTGQSTAQAAINALTNVAAATNEWVLTKDAGTGDATFKAAAGGSSLPVADTQTIVMGSVDNTKLLRFEVDGFTAGATRVMTPPNQDAIIAGLNVIETFTALQTFTGDLQSNRGLGTDSFIAGGGGNATMTGASNIILGSAAGGALTSGFDNILMGVNAGASLTTGRGNFGLGKQALSTGTTQTDCVAIGGFALGIAVGNDTIGIGTRAGYNSWESSVCIGTDAGNLTTAHQTRLIAIGPFAFNAATACNSSIAIGYSAGQNNARSNVLIIANSNTVNPLIYGEFDTGLVRVNGSDSTTSTVVDTLYINRLSTGTPAAGFGVGVVGQLESSTTESQNAGRLIWEWTTATHASRKALSKWTVYDTAEREAIRIEASGSAAMLGFLGAVAIARPAAYTQTYATATRTFSAYTSDPESGAYTGIDNLQVGNVYATVADLNQLRVAYETLRVFAENVGQLVNSLIDDGQSYGLLA